MSSAPYFKLYFSDLAGDTLHLSDAEIGSYVLLIGAMWNAGGRLPAEPSKLARIARVSPKVWGRRWEALADFFIEEGGFVSHKRVTSEREKVGSISEKRAAAGEAGAKAKALKTQETAQAIAVEKDTQTDKQTEDIPDTIVRKEPNGSSLSEANASSSDRDPTDFELRGEQPKPTAAKPRRQTPTTAEMDAIWQITPRPGRERSSRKDLERSLIAAMRRGHDPADVKRGVERAYASPSYSGDHAKGVHRLIEADRWRSFLEADTPPASAPATWAGPQDLLAAIIAETDPGFARNYVTPSRWVNGPHRQIVCRNDFAADILRKRAPEALRQFDATTVTEAETERAA